MVEADRDTANLLGRLFDDAAEGSNPTAVRGRRLGDDNHPSAVSFVDESTRGARYLLACTIVELAPPGRHPPGSWRRWCWPTASGSTSSGIGRSAPPAARYLQLPAAHLVNVCPIGPAVTQHAARAACLAAFVRDLLAQQVERIVLESRPRWTTTTRTIAATARPPRGCSTSTWCLPTSRCCGCPMPTPGPSAPGAIQRRAPRRSRRRPHGAALALQIPPRPPSGEPTSSLRLLTEAL
ncbi:MAG: hypothetical protein R2749_31685 [Acidimicrobiales bacterium]